MKTSAEYNGYAKGTDKITNHLIIMERFLVLTSPKYVDAKKTVFENRI